MHVQFKSGAFEQNIAESLESTCPFGSLKFYHRICMHALKRQSLKPCKYSQVSSIRTDIVQNLFKVNYGKLRFIWVAKKDNFMLLNF